MTLTLRGPTTIALSRTPIYFGRHTLREALAARAPISQIFLETPSAFEFAKSLPGFDRLKAEMTEGLPKEVKGEAHQGIAFQSNHSFYEAFSAKRALDFPIVILCNHLEDVHNLGSIVRSAAAFGAGLIIHEDRQSASVTPAVVKASVGCAFSTTFMRVRDLAEAISTLRSAGFSSAALDLSADAISLYEWKPKFPLALIVGSENRGISKEVRSQIKDFVRIPMERRIDSLNVSHAACLAMSWARQSRPSGVKAAMPHLSVLR